MSDYYVGEIRLFGGNYAPEGWALCNGATLTIAQYGELFALIGTAFGGDGRTTFQLPNLQGRLVCGTGQGPGLSNYTLGQAVGSAVATLTESQLPPHTHTMVASTVAATAATPTGNLYAACADGYTTYVTADAAGITEKDPNANMVSDSGEGDAHGNIMPFLAINYIIALTGTFPPTD